MSRTCNLLTINPSSFRPRLRYWLGWMRHHRQRLADARLQEGRLPCVACCDKIEERAHSVAAKFGSPLVTTNLEELVSHPEVQIVDLAVHAHQRLLLVEQIRRSRQAHLLAEAPGAQPARGGKV